MINKRKLISIIVATACVLTLGGFAVWKSNTAHSKSNLKKVEIKKEHINIYSMDNVNKDVLTHEKGIFKLIELQDNKNRLCYEFLEGTSNGKKTKSVLADKTKIINDITEGKQAYEVIKGENIELHLPFNCEIEMNAGIESK